MRVYDEDTLVLFGSSDAPFCQISYGGFKPQHISVFNLGELNQRRQTYGCTHWKRVCQCDKEECSTCPSNPWDLDMDYESRLSYYDFLGISDPTNLLETVSEMATIPLEKLEHLANGIDICEINIYSGEDQKDSESPTHHDIAGVQFRYINDNCILYHQGNPLVLYDKGSPGRQEYTVRTDGWKGFVNGETREKRHNFPLYFIPFDRSHREVWDDAYREWRKNKKKKVKGSIW